MELAKETFRVFLPIFGVGLSDVSRFRFTAVCGTNFDFAEIGVLCFNMAVRLTWPPGSVGIDSLTIKIPSGDSFI